MSGAVAMLHGPYTEGDQVGRQRQRLCKLQRLPAVTSWRLFHLPSVGNGGVFFGNGQADRERRLEARFVETRKRKARADRFHLRHRIGLTLRRYLVQALQLRVERRGIFKSQRQRLRLQRAAEIHARHTGFRVRRGVSTHMRRASGVDDGHLRYLQLAAVQPKMIGGLAELDLDRGGAGEIFLCRIDLERQRVGLRNRPERQPALRHLISRGSKRSTAARGQRSQQKRTNKTTHEDSRYRSDNRPR
jgi:hypothetical protein